LHGAVGSTSDLAHWLVLSLNSIKGLILLFSWARKFTLIK